MSDPAAKPSPKPEALLDAIEDSAEVRFRPTQVDALVRLVENHQEMYFDAGMLWFRDKEGEKLLMDVLDELERDLPTPVFERAKWKAALSRVIVRRKDEAEIPF